MAATALIKFTQGANTDIAGRAVLGTVADGVVTVTNGNNADVASWRIELLYAPPASALVVGVLTTGVSAVPAAAFTPDVSGCYRIRSTVWDSSGNSNVDIRNFGVPTLRGFVVPPYQMDPEPIAHTLKADELNFGGQAFGWSGGTSTGLLETFFDTYTRKIFKSVVTAPYTASEFEADIYAVATNSMAAPCTLNLPVPAVGQVIEVFDSENAAGTYNIRVAVPAGHTFSDGSPASIITVDSGHVVVAYAGGTVWFVLATSPIIAPVFSVHSNTTDAAYAIQPNTEMLLLMGTTSIGVASLVTLTAGIPLGQEITIADSESGAYAYPITVSVPAGHTFVDGTTSKTISTNYGMLAVLQSSAGSWVVTRDTNRSELLTIFSGVHSTSSLGYVRVSSFALDSADLSASTCYEVSVILETTNATMPAHARLYNVTTGAVAGAVMSSASLTAQKVSQTLIVFAGSIEPGANVYEVQLCMDNGVAPEAVTLSGAQIHAVCSYI